MFSRNTKGLVATYSTLELARCTFYNNGPTMLSVGGGPLTINQSIFAFDSGVAVACSPTHGPTLTCCDLFGDPAHCFQGCTPTLQDMIYEDPLFCDAAAGDFTLTQGSPCLLGNSPCQGVIGAFGIGCVVVGAGAELEATSWG